MIKEYTGFNCCKDVYKTNNYIRLKNIKRNKEMKDNIAVILKPEKYKSTIIELKEQIKKCNAMYKI